MIKVNDKYKHLESWIDSLPEMFDTTGDLIYDKRNKVRIANIDGKKMVIKKFKVPNIFQRLAYTISRPTKARRAFEYAERLLTMGIDTPEPVAYIEVRGTMLFRQGFFVSGFCGWPNAMALADGTAPEGLDAAFAGFLATMHAKGFMHGDLNLTNILWQQQGNGTFAFTVIDINRSRFITNPSRQQCLNNLMRITHNRPLLRRIVTLYAQQRGWDATASVDSVVAAVNRFERKKNILGILKGKGKQF